MKEIIITSSVLILCIIFIRIIFKGKISSRLQYALWLLVTLRLMIPSSAQIHMAIGSIEEFRIMDIVESLEERFGDMTGQLEKPVRFTMSLNTPLGEQAAEFMLGEDLNVPDSQDGPTSVFLAGSLGLLWLDVFRGIWIGGMVVIGIWMVTTNIVFARKLRKSRKEFTLPEELEEKLHDGQRKDGKCCKWKERESRIRFYIADCLTSSCLYGIPGREVVYLTTDITEDEQKLRHVVTHELCHKKHGDSFWSLVRSVLLCAYWMNPLVWVATVLSKRDCELACDEAALAILGEEERIPYGETLLSIITGKSRLSDIACTATTMNGSGKSVKERIKFIANQPKVLGAAIAAALILVMIVSVLAFTKSPLFSGSIWEGEITLIAGDMRVVLPESIAGISGYEMTEEGSDIIIYQVSSGKEAGRFSVLSYEEAIVFVDEGREIVLLGNYGSNPMLDHDFEVVPLEEQEQAEGVIAHEDTFYTEEIGQTVGVPGTDINEETTYMIDDSGSTVNTVEESVDYLPNEQITEIDIPPASESVTEHHYYMPAEIDTDKCYLYVKADYSDVKEKYLEEMEYINSELEHAAGRVIVLRVNRAIRDEMFAALAQNRTEYLGDATKTSALVNALPKADGLSYMNIRLHTLETEPETALSLDVNYMLTTQSMPDEAGDMLFFNAAMLFATIKNLEECSFVITKGGTASDYKADYLDGGEAEGSSMPDGYEYTTLTYNRDEMEETVGIMWSEEAHESDEEYIQWLEDLYVRITDYLP